MSPSPIVTIENLEVSFGTSKGTVAALRGVDLQLQAGKTLALVGESGSGKSVTSLALMGLLPKESARITAGRILLRDQKSGSEQDLVQASEATMRTLRGGHIAMIFQEPMTSLNPLYRVGEQIGETLRLHRGLNRAEARKRAKELLDLVGIPDAEKRLDAYPHELSGGMRQRVMIAMAIACEPAVLIADEPTTALDVTVQAQILDLLRELQQRIGMAMLFITHNLGVVADIADEVAVMYGGRIVESGPTATLLSASNHPYTRGLLCSMPPAVIDENTPKRLPALSGNVVDPRNPPPGCAFAPRCHAKQPACELSVPALNVTDAPNHLTRCFRWKEINHA
ncbi:MAG: ABC transporter ATP-binding protein [Formivibrio sp.]|nr:ABC transporter ATP-binding protein [Formivibrio sp.]